MNIQLLGDYQVWYYNVGHGELLLRKVKDSKNDKCIDILFVNTKLINLPTSFSNPKIYEQDNFDWLTVKEEISMSNLENLKAYRIEAKNCKGLIVAGNADWCESDSEYYEDTPLKNN